MSEPRWLNDTEMRAWTGFLETSDLIRRQVERQLQRDGGLTMVQYEILTRLDERPDRRATMTQLAALVICSRSGLTYQVAQLEKSGLLAREADPTDERAVLAVLTDAGRRILERTAPGHLDTVRAGFLDLLTPQQISQLAEITDITRGHLREVVSLIPPRSGRGKPGRSS